jgi:hypothetical protein
MFERAPRKREIVFNPLLQIRVVTNVNDARAQGRVQIIKIFASGNTLCELVHIVYGTDEVFLRRRIIDKRL